jgi:hypothetical protein
MVMSGFILDISCEFVGKPGAGLFSIGARAEQSGAPARIIFAVNTAANLEHII